MPAICPLFCTALGLQYPYLEGLFHMQGANLGAVRHLGGKEVTKVELEGGLSNSLSPRVVEHSKGSIHSLKMPRKRMCSFDLHPGES